MNRTHRLRALIVDDDPAVLRLLSRFFTRLDWEPQTVPTAAAALEVFTPGKFTVAVCDCDLGGENGVALAQRLHETDPDVAIIVASGNPDNLDRARRAGFGQCLAKPFTVAEFIEVVSGSVMRKAVRSKS